MLYQNKMTKEWREDVLTRIGQNVHRKRIEAGWTFNAMYARTGILPQTLFYWETAQRSPKIEVLLWLCKTTGWRFSEIVGKTSSVTPDGATPSPKGKA